MSSAPAGRILALVAKAQAHHRAGQLAEAADTYARAARLDGSNAEIWHLLGVVSYQLGNVAKAIEHYTRAVGLRPRAAEFLNNLALAQRANGDVVAAAESFAQALSVRPEYATAAFNLGLLREQLGDAVAAERAYRQVLASQPTALNALTNLGNLLRRLGRLDQAEPLLARAHLLASDDAQTAGNLALLRIDQARHAEAIALATAATQAEPDNASWWEALGTALRLAQDADAAVAPLRRAAELAPAVAANHLQLALALQETGDAHAAEIAFAQACALEPNWPRLRWAQALSVPAMPASTAQQETAIAAFEQGLAQLEADCGAIDAAFESVQAITVFGLHYLPGDHTARQCRFGDLVSTVVARARPALVAAPVRPVNDAARRLRVAFVSSYLHEHVVERYFGGWIRDLDPQRFEKFVWYSGAVVDERVTALRGAVDHFEQPAGSLDDCAAAIRAADIDVVIYLDIGLDPRQQVLAAMRLAPVQCAAYGHPLTSGLPSIDFFLSGDALEPADAAAHYRERLVRLPGLGCSPRPPMQPLDEDPLAALRRPGRALVLCLQHLIKLPQAFDPVLARVLAHSGAQLVLFSRSAGLTQRFRARLAESLRRVGVDIDDAVHILPAMPYARYLAAVQHADLVLDSPGFSGGGTSLDALGMATPVVTLEGQFARGRQTAVMLRRLDVAELIAADEEAYIALATTLIADAPQRARLRATLAARRQHLFENAAVMPALEQFLIDAAAGAVASAD